MAYRMLAVALVLSLALAVPDLARAVRPRPDCSNSLTNEGVSFSAFPHVCHALYEAKSFERATDMKDPINKLELVEMCACSLVNHELAWASLITHEAEIFFLALKELIDERMKEDTEVQALIKGEAKSMFEKREGERRYYWNSLDYILGQRHSYLSKQLPEHFKRLYYNPKTFKRELNSEGHYEQSTAVSTIRDVCNLITARFFNPFALIFDRLSRLAGNDQLLFTLTAYNDDLYKLRMLALTCAHLWEKKQLLDQWFGSDERSH